VITLVLGGARSGKSRVAEQMAARLTEPVTYIATVDTASLARDEDLAARVAVHQSRRPPAWRTIEADTHLAAAVARVTGTVLIDALGPWVARWAGFSADVDELCRALTTRPGDSVVVSEEVGLGVHPSSAEGRRFRDALGEVNQAVAAVAGDVVFVVAGRVLRLQDPSVAR